MKEKKVIRKIDNVSRSSIRSLGGLEDLMPKIDINPKTSTSGSDDNQGNNSTNSSTTDEKGS